MSDSVRPDEQVMDLTAEVERAKRQWEAEHAAASPEHRAIDKKLIELFPEWEGDQRWFIAHLLADVSIAASKPVRPDERKTAIILSTLVGPSEVVGPFDSSEEALAYGRRTYGDTEWCIIDFKPVRPDEQTPDEHIHFPPDTEDLAF